MSKDKHWLMRPKTIKLLWWLFVGILVLTLVPGFFLHQHEHFGIEGSFGFYAWYGFITCMVMIVVAKLLGTFLKREDSYYDD